MQKKKTGIVIAGVLAAVILLVVFYDFFAEKTVFHSCILSKIRIFKSLLARRRLMKFLPINRESFR